MPEEDEAQWQDDHEDISLAGRVELMGIALGYGEHLVLTDPEHETAEAPSGVQRLGMAVALDMAGHLHIPGLPCIPATVPFLLSPKILNDLIRDLTEARDKIAETLAEQERS